MEREHTVAPSLQRNPLEQFCCTIEFCCGAQLSLALHFLLDSLLLHLRFVLQALSQSLLGESLVIDAADGIADETEILCYQYGVFRKETQEGHLLIDQHRQFRHNLDAVLAFFR